MNAVTILCRQGMKTICFVGEEGRKEEEKQGPTQLDENDVIHFIFFIANHDNIVRVDKTLVHDRKQDDSVAKQSVVQHNPLFILIVHRRSIIIIGCSGSPEKDIIGVEILFICL